MARGATVALATFVGGLLVAGCAAIPSGPSSRLAAVPDEAFGIDGRLSARQGTQAITAHFAWTHAAPRDEFVVANPLGQAIAQLDGDGSIPRVEVRMADGRRDEARDWSELTARTVGFALPVDWLAAWVRGAPHDSGPYEAEVDAAGRARVLRQYGWEIVYAYADADTRHASRLRLAYPEVEVAIVIDRWRN